MTSPAGPQSHFLWRWMASSSRAGVFLSASPGEEGSVRSSCSSPGVDVSLEDSFSTQFAPLSVSRSSVDSSEAQYQTPSSTEADMGLPAARNPQGLIERLQEVSRGSAGSQSAPELKISVSELGIKKNTHRVQKKQ